MTTQGESANKLSWNWIIHLPLLFPFYLILGLGQLRPTPSDVKMGEDLVDVDAMLEAAFEKKGVSLVGAWQQVSATANVSS